MRRERTHDRVRGEADEGICVSSCVRVDVCQCWGIACTASETHSKQGAGLPTFSPGILGCFPSSSKPFSAMPLTGARDASI